MTSYRTQTIAVTAPGPDDSDFQDSESELSVDNSIVEQVETNTMPSMSQRSLQSNQMTEMEAELAAVATPINSQATTSYLSQQNQVPTPATKIMQLTSNFSFTFFDGEPPQVDMLNKGDGRQAAGLPLNPRASPQRSTRLRQHSEANKEIVSAIAPHLAANTIVHWFSIDKELVYLSFFDDWGPLNVAMFYRFCLHLHHLIGMMQEKAASGISETETAPEVHLILYTSSQPRAKANAALLAAMYAMVCGDMTPADAFHPISELELVPFRDAGYGRADFYLTVQDILYGVHRAVNEKLLDLMTFDLDEYETYEQVQNGDWNWITPNIIAFASPNDKEYVADLRAGTIMNGRATPGLRRPLNPTFTKTIQYFKEKNVKLVVRLNNPLYDSRVFEREGIQHVDMYFDDGSNPSEDIIRDFIERANETISKGGAIAVHCKAGLGRTGVLIGAYLAYRHGFSASESIGFMRIMRPGCVVGPQQHFMYKESSNWIRWREQDDARIELERALAKQKLELVGTRRRKSDEMEANSSNEESYTDLEVDVALGHANGRQIKKIKRDINEEPCTPKKNLERRNVDEKEEEKNSTALPALLTKPTPCVGQPRKSPSPSRKRAAQAQAPATVARMGGLASSSKGRILSGSHRSFSGSSFTRAIERVNETAQENEGQTQQQQQQQQQRPASMATTTMTPGGSRVLGDARRINIQVSIEEGEVAVSTPRADDWNAANQAKASMMSSTTKPEKTVSHSRSKSGNSIIDDGLFTEGWKSPDPPTVYMDRIAQSPTRSPLASVLPTPSTPTSPSTPTQGVRASPQIREKFGLRETGSMQGTPRSRKEVIGIASSDSNGSSSSSGTSLTSRDAPGSEDEELCAGPLETIKSATKPTTVQQYKPTTTVKQTAQTMSNRGPIPSSRTASREKMTTTTRSASNSSSSSLRTTSGSRVPSSTARRALPGKSTVNTAISAAPASSAHSGRVAAARDQLTQRQAAAAQQARDQLVHRSNLKRSRVYSPDMGSVEEPKTTTAPSGTLVPSHIANQFGLGINATNTIITSAQSKSNVVPRFALATAASAAKSQHNVVDHSGRFQRGGPVHSITTKAINGSILGTAPSTASMARLNGRNVRRRRSSIS